MKKINVFLYSSLLISMFLKIRVYPLIILIIICMNSIILIKDRKIKMYQILVFIFLVYNFFSYFNTPMYEIKNQNLIKLIISFTYLLFFEYSFKKYDINDFKNFFYKINKVIEILLCLNLVQIILIYLKNNISLFKLFVLKTSDEAYIINFKNIYMFVGNENKNIWSSKIGIILIIYLFTQKYIQRKKINKIMLLIGILNIGLVLSRTGILFLILFMILIALEELKKTDIKLKVLIVLTSLFPIYLVMKKIYFKIFRIDFSNMNDGGLTRLFNWNLFRNNFFKENYVIGVGLGGTSQFLKKYKSILIDGHMHNVIINMLLELGIIGGLLYIIILLKILLILKKNLNYKAFILVIPFFIVLMLQYMGYDNDIVIYFSFILLISYSFKEEKDEYIVSSSNSK